jgi:glucokinase
MSWSPSWASGAPFRFDKPQKQYKIYTSMGKEDAPVLAVDIGGTKIMTALFTSGGKMIAREVSPTLAGESAPAVIERICRAIDSILEGNNIETARVAGIGVACAGGIDSTNGVVVTPSPNIRNLVNVPLAEILREKFRVGAFIVNDASAAALGEHLYGAGRGVKNLVLFTLGTGIGGGIIADGRLYLGARGGAGELGHMTVAADGPVCGCGNTGCLEMLASGRAVERDAISRLQKGVKSSLLDMVDGKIENVTAEQVGEAARNGDPLALEVLARAAYYLGIGMVNVVNIFSPEMVVCGGGMAELGDLLIGPGRRMVNERAFSISSQAVRIVTAELGNEAGVYGAAAFARERMTRGTA